MNAPAREDDVAMGNINKPPANPIVGGIFILQSKLNGIVAAATLAVEHFNSKVFANEETEQIKKATTAAGPTLQAPAVCIAEVVNGERPVSAPTLCGVVRTETEKAISDLKSKVQSLRVQVASSKEKKKPPKCKPTDRKANDRKNSNRSGTANTSKDFHSRNGKATGKGFAHIKNCESHPGSGRATSATKGKSTKNSSPKQHGKKNASGCKKSD